MNKIFLLVVTLLFSSSIYATSIFADSVSTSNGSQITVAIKTSGFVDVISFQGTLTFDETVLSFVGTEQYNIVDLTSSSFNVTTASSGYITYSWTDNSYNGVTLADSSVLWVFKFDVIGTAGQKTSIGFSNTPTNLELRAYPTFAPSSVTYVNGEVAIPTVTNVQKIANGISKLNTFPNPFINDFQMSFDLKESSNVNFRVYNVLGKELANVQKSLQAGNITLSGNGLFGNAIQTKGIYFVVASVNGQTITQRIIKK